MSRVWLADDAPGFEVHALPDRWRPTPRRILSGSFAFSGRAAWDTLRDRLAHEVSNEIVVHRTCVDPEAEPGETCEVVRVPWPCEWDDLQSALRERLAQDYMTGDCPHYAVALHRRNGWPIRGVIDRDPAAPHLRVMHVWAVRPDGVAVDAEGAKDEEALVAHYVSRHGGAREDLTEAEILSWYAVSPDEEDRWESPREWEPWVPVEALWLASVLESDAEPRPECNIEASPSPVR